jgi:ABC-type phosphate transport system substrate-binding protein
MRATLLFLAFSAAAFAQDKPRVYITDSDSWQTSGGFSGGGADGVGAVAGSSSGGARPQTAEIMKTFGEKCPGVTVTINRERADYIVILQHEGGKEFFQKDNKVAVFNKEGDMVLSNSSRSLGNAVKEACGRVTSARRVGA